MSTFIRKDEPGMVAHTDADGTEHSHTWDNPGDHVEVTSDDLAQQLLRQDGFTEVNEDGSPIEGGVPETDVVALTSLIDPGLDTLRPDGQTPGRSEIRTRIDGTEEAFGSTPGAAASIDSIEPAPAHEPSYTDDQLLEYFDQVETHGEDAVQAYLALERLYAAGITDEQLEEYFVLEQEVGSEVIQAYLAAEAAAGDQTEQ